MHWKVDRLDVAMHYILNNIKYYTKHIVDSMVLFIFAVNLNFTVMKIKYRIVKSPCKKGKCDCRFCVFGSSECIFEDCPLPQGFIFNKVAYE